MISDGITLEPSHGRGSNGKIHSHDRGSILMSDGITLEPSRGRGSNGKLHSHGRGSNGI